MKTNELTTELIKELYNVQKTFKDAYIAYNATTDEFFVSIIPLNFCNSIFLTKIENYELR